MPALSQNLEFVVNNTTTTVVIYPVSTTTAQTYISNPVKAANYYGITNNVQTAEIKITNFVGTVTLQATLASAPIEADWFDVSLGINTVAVDTTGLVSQSVKKTVAYSAATTKSEIYNFEGNYVWLRAKISAFTQGTVNGISLNY